MCCEFLGWSTRFEIAVTIWKPNDAIGVRNVQKLRVVPGWIKSNTEWLVQTSFCKSFSHIRLAITVCIAQHLYLVRATLDNEDVAIRRREQETRIAKSARIQFDFKSGWNFGSCVSRPTHNSGSIDCESIGAWWRQILLRDFAHDAGRIGCPIAHCSFAGEECALFSGRAG